MSRAQSLHRLQEIDRAIDTNTARLDEISHLLAHNRELEQAKSALEEAEDALNSARSDLHSAEGLVSTQKFKIEETEKTLYSGSVQNPRELQDLQMESESLARYLATLEDRLLEAMLAHEETEQEYAAAKALVEQILQTREQEHRELLKEQSHIMNEMVRLENDREAALASVPDEDLELYESLRATQRGLAVALLDGNNCSLCGLSIGSSIEQTIRSGTTLVQCSQCKRILYSG